MFWCVALDDVDAFLRDMGFRLLGKTELTLVYGRGEQRLTIRNAQILPEILVDEAFNNAEVSPPPGGWKIFQTAP